MSVNLDYNLFFSAMIGLPMPHFYDTVAAPHLLDIGQVNVRVVRDSCPNILTITG